MLEQNYPNPFRTATFIKYTVPSESNDGFDQHLVKLRVMDALGTQVALLVNGYQHPGSYEIRFDAQSVKDFQDLPVGVYYYKLTIDHLVFTNKMILLK